MALKPRVLIVIPARSGSKGIPGKNVVDLGGLPLLAWSIAVAQEAAFSSRIIVSTDSEEFAAIARAHGAEVPFLRPTEIAGDQALVNDAVRHVTSELEKQGEQFEIILILFPTSPFRSPKLLETCVEVLQQGAFGVTTVAPEEFYPQLVFAKEGDRFVPSSSRTSGTVYRRIALVHGSRQHPAAVRAQAPGSLARERAMLQEMQKGNWASLLSARFVPIDDPAMLVDIDTAEDLQQARNLLSKGELPWVPQCLKLKVPQLARPRKLTQVPKLLVSRSTGIESIEIPGLTKKHFLSPENLRALLDELPELRNRPVAFGMSRSQAKGFFDSTSPKAVLLLSANQHIKGLKEKLRRLVDWAVFDVATLRANGKQEPHSAGGIRCELSGNECRFVFSEQPRAGDLLSVAERRSDERQCHSGFYRFQDGRWSWESDPLNALEPHSLQLLTSKEGFLSCVLDLESQIVHVGWYREEAAAEPTFPMAGEVVLLDHLTGYDPQHRQLRNLRTSQRIQGRQDYPEAYEWAGAGFLPAGKVSEKWQILFS